MPKDIDQTILQLYARTPAPCRDYCGLTITGQDVILNIWNVTNGPHVYPKRYKCGLEQLANHKHLRMEIGRVFGQHVLDYTDCLSKNETKLENLSTKIFLTVLNYLAAKDILNLSQTSRIMFERCNDDSIWKIMFRKLYKHAPTDKDLQRIEKNGWRATIKEKWGWQNLVNPTFIQVNEVNYSRKGKSKEKIAPSKSAASLVNKNVQKKKVNNDASSKTLFQGKSDTKQKDVNVKRSVHVKHLKTKHTNKEIIEYPTKQIDKSLRK